MEDALPTTSTTSTLLAPEEVYAPNPNAALADKSDLTPSAKRSLRQKSRSNRKRNAEKADKLSGGGAAKEKENARRKLVGNRGVTVIGKDGKKQKSVVKGKQQKSEAVAQNGVRLKL